MEMAIVTFKRWSVTVTILAYISACIGCSVTEYVPEQNEIQQAQRMIDQGTQYLRVGDFESARSSFLVAEELGLAAPALDGLGCVSLLEGVLHNAEKLFLAARAADPEYAEVLGNLALTYEAQNRYDEAGAMYVEAIKLMPNNYRVRNNYSVFLADRRRPDGSVNARGELLKARALISHPIIENNVEAIDQVLNDKTSMVSRDLL